MKEYKLTKKLEFGIKEIDDQHRHIIELVNNFSKIDPKSFSRDDILDFFNEIISYAHDHFKTEEKFFKEKSYPETKEHILEHQNLLAKINDLFLAFSDNEINQTVNSASDLLKFWIEDHLMRVDKKYVNFLLKK